MKIECTAYNSDTGKVLLEWSPMDRCEREEKPGVLAFVSDAIPILKGSNRVHFSVRVDGDERIRSTQDVIGTGKRPRLYIYYFLACVHTKDQATVTDRWGMTLQ